MSSNAAPHLETKNATPEKISTLNSADPLKSNTFSQKNPSSPSSSTTSSTSTNNYFYTSTGGKQRFFVAPQQSCAIVSHFF
jgi:hypothetical protein